MCIEATAPCAHATEEKSWNRTKQQQVDTSTRFSATESTIVDAPIEPVPVQSAPASKPTTRPRACSWKDRRPALQDLKPTSGVLQPTRRRAKSWTEKRGTAVIPAWLRFVSLWLQQLRVQLLDTSSPFGDGGHAELGDVLLPPQLGPARATLVLDLDETLVHVDAEKSLHVRPGAVAFLAEVVELYEVVVYTAAERYHADPILDLLEQEARVSISHRLYREHCQVMGEKQAMVKDLRRLGRDMGRILIVDNSPESFVFQPENAVPIESYFGGGDDAVLPEMLVFLKRVDRWVQKEGDVRPRLERCHRHSCFHSHAKKLELK